MSEACERRNKWIGACSFEARYDEGAAPYPPGNYSGPAGGLERITASTKPLTYVCDICTRCGRVVERKQEMKA